MSLALLFKKRPLTPLSPPIEKKLSSSGISTTATIFKRTESPVKKGELDDKWSDLFDTDKKDDPIKDDLLSKLTTDEQDDRKILPKTKPSMIMFEPTSISTNGNPKKSSSSRRTSTTAYDFDQAIINLHEGKPVTTQPTTTTTKTSIDPFEALFDNNTTKLSNRLATRNDTFTTTQEKTRSFRFDFLHIHHLLQIFPRLSNLPFDRYPFRMINYNDQKIVTKYSKINSK